MELITSFGVPDSPARVEPSERSPLRVGAVQLRWRRDPVEHADAITAGIELAVEAGATVVCLQELTLSPYLASVAGGPGSVDAAEPWGAPEPLPGGPTYQLAAASAQRHGIFVQASLWEADPAVAPRGYNTSICVGPDGALVARTRKLHIPVTAGYHEDRWFAPGDGRYPVVPVGSAHFGFPTCWDQWFPELARAYSLGGAEVLVYPTAIGSEPHDPALDTRDPWQRAMIGHAVSNVVPVVAANRIGDESGQVFYGSSFIADPRGDKVAELGRAEEGVITASFDLDAIRRTRAAWGFFRDRRPELYGVLATADGKLPSG